MSIEINTSARGVNWESLLSSLGEVQKTNSVNGHQNFTITSKVDGAEKTVTVSVPDDLEIPETVDQSTLEGLVDKLKETGLGFTDEQVAQMKDAIAKIYNGSTDAAIRVASNSKGQVLFDSDARMSLMIEVAQSQRDAAREMRTAENLSIQKAIQNQADEQRSAAMVGMIVGITCGIASAAVSIGTMIGQGISAKTQSNIMAQSGADAAKMHSTALQNTDTVANAQAHLEQVTAKVGNDVATRVNDDFTAQLTDDQAGNLKTNFDTAKANVDAKQQSLDTAKTELQAANTRLTEKTQAKNEAQTRVDKLTDSIDAYWEKNQYIQSKGGIENADPNVLAEFNNRIGENADNFNVNQAHVQLEAAQADLTRANTELTTAQNDVQVKQGAVDLANTDLANAKTALTQAKSDYVKTVQDVAAQYTEKYQTAVDRLNNPPEGADKAQLKQDVETARTEMEMAYAKETRLLADAMSPSEQKDLVALARARVDTTMDRVTQRADFKAAERKMSTLMGINNINQAIGGVMQSTASNLAALQSAEATRTGADKTKQDEMLDQTKDLFAQEQKLIDQVIQLFSAVIQTENQSMRDAIQA